MEPHLDVEPDCEDGDDRVRPAAIAALCGLERSTVSRYLARWPKLRGDDGLVSITEWNAHRRENMATDDARSINRDRREAADAQLAELRLGREQGDLKPTKQVAAIVTDAIGELLTGFDTDLEPALRKGGVRDTAEALKAVRAIMSEKRQAFAAALRALADPEA
ncbi:MAG: hypothetical protein AAFR84_14320 [Pseudomonadota bacterium]